jgi:UPF0755 protein
MLSGVFVEQFLGPAATPGKEVVVLIRPGTTLPAAAQQLEAAGVIKNAYIFMGLAKVTSAITGVHAGIRAGEFQLHSGWAPREILRIITTTGGILHKVVVREGLPWWEVSKLYEAEGLTDRASFERAMKNATLLQKYGIPGTSAEGFLFPETYQLSRSFDNGGPAIVEAMLKEGGRQMQKLWPAGPPSPEELKRLVTLASLVERETGDATERARIAGVFVNRLRTGMRLQCDPTTIYGLGPSFDGDLRRSNLEDAANPYNTYAHAGLPPGPICSPGLEALRAALHPEDHEFVYFVAKGDGSHQFSRTLEEHNRAVTQFQRHRDKDNYRSTKR